jgi:hypothetical protein
MPKSAKPTVRYDEYTTITQKCRKITPGKDYREKCGLGHKTVIGAKVRVIKPSISVVIGTKRQNSAVFSFNIPK